MSPPPASPAGPSRWPPATDVADGLLCVLVFQRATALSIGPRGAAYEALLTREAAPEPIVELPHSLGHAVAARLGLIAGLDPWGAGDRLGRIVARLGHARGEYVVMLREADEGFSVELRRLVEGATAGASTAELEEGSARIGLYHVEAEIGRGSMGIVYRARREGSEDPVAVKLLNPSIASDPAMAARFVREGRAAALVNDPGVVGVTDFGFLPDGQGFLVMELVEGRTLEEKLEEDGALPPEEAVRIASRVATALASAHVRGVIHRDLKPSNIFLIGDDQIKIADFGAALVEDRLRGGIAETTVILGTPAYMAPEQAQALPTDDRADVYSLGCILFRMLTGAPPFQGASLLEVLRKHIDDLPPRVTSPHGPLPPVLVQCVARTLTKNPDDRYRSMGEMNEDLARARRELAEPGQGRDR